MRLDTGWDLHVHFAIDRCFQLLVAQIFHPHLGVLLGIEVVIHAHPFVQVAGVFTRIGCLQLM